ncbi:MarR family transcriptional regulator [bacterium BD-1]|uniref:MarR family winged helix-turn-helix transcriptional regulator n=1 Tax=Arenimonas sp. TaxID=1872635 RepID=UPI001E2E4426|nr:MarR family transcriptional regulator [Ottowia caeni]
MADSIDHFFARWRAQAIPGIDIREDVHYLYRMVRICKLLSQRVEACCTRHGLTPSQYEALSALLRHSPTPLSAQDLMAASMLTSGSVTAMISQLVSSGLVERTQCPKDRRRIEVRITAEGTRVVKAAIFDRLTDNELLSRLLEGSDQKQADRLMRKLLASLEGTGEALAA